jgi:hypothetical protein
MLIDQNDLNNQQKHMSITTKLLSLDFIFSQQKPLTPDEFLREYQRRVPTMG